MPRLVGVQAEGSAFLADAWRFGEDVVTKPAIATHTVADSIAAGLPRDRVKAMAAVRDTGGGFVTVSDDEILAAIPAVAGGAGFSGSRRRRHRGPGWWLRCTPVRSVLVIGW